MEQTGTGAKAPAEIRDMVWRAAFVPQKIIVDHVAMSREILTPLVLRSPPHPLSFRRSDPFEAVEGEEISGEVTVDKSELENFPADDYDLNCSFNEVKKGPDRQASLMIDRGSRETTLSHYSQILQRSVPAKPRYMKYSSDIYRVSGPTQLIAFNFDIDTLTVNPIHVRRAIFQPEEDSISHLEIREELGNPRTPDESLCILTTLLREPENNLAKFRSTAIGHFGWWPKPDTPYSQPANHLRTQFVQEISNGFQNLKELLLVLPEQITCCIDRTDRGHNDTCLMLNLIDPGVRVMIRKEITDMFEAEKLLRPACKIPEIIFLDPEDPRAPRFCHWVWRDCDSDDSDAEQAT
jgi:hypothetical protein